MAYKELTKEMLENECGLFLKGEDIYKVVSGTNQWHKKGDIIKVEPRYITISPNYIIGIIVLHNAKLNISISSGYARVKWALKYGSVPSHLEIDHIDHNTKNNNFSNLRLITKAENLRQKKQKNNQYSVNWTEEERETYLMKIEKEKNYKETKSNLKRKIEDIKLQIKALKADLRNTQESLADLNKAHREETL